MRHFRIFIALLFSVLLIVAHSISLSVHTDAYSQPSIKATYDNNTNTITVTLTPGDQYWATEWRLEYMIGSRDSSDYIQIAYSNHCLASSDSVTNAISGTYTISNCSRGYRYAFTLFTNTHNYGGVHPCCNTSVIVPEQTKCSTPSVSVSSNNSATSTPTVYWGSVAGAGNYKVSVGSTVYITTSTSYSLSSLSKGTAYSVKVMAVAGSSAYIDSDWSSAITVTNAYKTPLSAPSLSVSATSSQAISVTIGSVSNATSYTLQYSTNSSFSGAITRSVSAGSSSIAGLSANTTYYFRVKANTTATYYADSSYSSYKSCTTKKIVLGSPALNSIIVNDATSVDVNFTTVENANQYVVEYTTSSDFSNKKTITIV